MGTNDVTILANCNSDRSDYLDQISINSSNFTCVILAMLLYTRPRITYDEILRSSPYPSCSSNVTVELCSKSTLVLVHFSTF